MAIHNITPLTDNSGRTDYSLDTILDKDNLPKIGLITGSTAQVYDGGELKVYYFTKQSWCGKTFRASETQQNDIIFQ